MPEISLTTNTAGLYDVGFNVPCATFTCQKGLGVQDINKPLYAPLAYGLIREVETIATSGMMHIGSDERVSGAECFEEALDETPDFASFEQKLKYLLEFDGITNSQIVRWSNEENIEYPDRLGTITQCREGDCRTGNTGSWIATFDLQKGGPYEIYNSARELVLRNPMAIVAEVGNILRDESEHYNIPKRMLAYAMGISDIKEWSQGMFEETFIPLCTELFGPTAGCSEFSKSHEGIEGASALPIANQERLCQERTRNTTRHVYRPEFQEIVTSVEVHSFDQAGL